MLLPSGEFAEALTEYQASDAAARERLEKKKRSE